MKQFEARCDLPKNCQTSAADGQRDCLTLRDLPHTMTFTRLRTFRPAGRDIPVEILMASRMSERDLTIPSGPATQRAEFTCLLTGQRCSLVPVKLRRMFVFPPIWIGWQSVVLLPLHKAPALVVWQYLRMLRPYVVLFGLVLSSAALQLLVGPKPRGAVVILGSVTLLAITIGLWCLLGRLLDHFEFVRLLRYDHRRGTVTIRFSTETLAQEASKFFRQAG